MESTDVIVIGAGLSGLAAAALCGRPAIVLEQLPEPGRRFRMAAMGAAPLSNTELGLAHFHGRDSRFVADALAAWPLQALTDWFGARGVNLDAGPHYGLILAREGPEAALLALIDTALEHAELRTETRVTALHRAADGFRARLDDGRVLAAPNVVLASGGPNYPQTGGGEAALRMAAALGHRVAPASPAQAPLALIEPWLKDLAGLWMDVRLALLRDGREVAAETGSVLFTRAGLTGEAALNLARHVPEGEALTLAVNFFPELSRADVEEWQFRTLGERTREIAASALDHMLPRRLAQALLTRQGVKPGTRVRQLSLRQRQGLLSEMTDMRLALAGTLGLNAAESALGGVHVREIDPRTFASRVVPGLYVVGQALDVTPDWGGFAQHFSLASGFCAGQALRLDAGAQAG